MSDQTFTGTVSIEDANPPPADYTPARKVNVQVTFNGTDPAALESNLARAATFASVKVAELLGRTPAPLSAAPAEDGATSVRTRKARSTAATSATAEPIADESAEVAAARARIIDEGRELITEDPFAVGGQTVEEDAFDIGTVQPAEVTDADLNAAIQKKNGEINDPTKIRTLIATFNPDPTKAFQVREIVQAQRPDFIAKLEKLTKG